MAHEQTTPTLYGLMAEFDTPTKLVKAAERVRLAGFKNFDAYSPIPIEELSEAMGMQRTRLPLIVLLGGIFGGLGLWSRSAQVIATVNIGGRRCTAGRILPVIRDPVLVPPGRLRRIVGAKRLRTVHPLFNVTAFDRASRKGSCIEKSIRASRRKTDCSQRLCHGISVCPWQALP